MYKVYLTPEFKESFSNIKDYLLKNVGEEFYLKVEDIVINKIEEISENPLMYKEDDILGEGIRKVIMEKVKYTLFFVINENIKTIYIIDICHFKEDKVKKILFNFSSNLFK